MAKPPPMFKHQAKSKKTILGIEDNVVFDTSDPGTGKTRVQIEVLAAKHEANEAKRAIVVAPKTLLTSVWEDQIAEYAPGLTTAAAYAGEREEAFASGADVCIINTDGVRWLANQPPRFFKDFNHLIIDESADFKHRGSARSKALFNISKHFDYRAAMSGTPNTNSITELWHQAKILDGGQRLGKSFVQFRNAVCVPRQVGPAANMLEWADRENAAEVVASLLADISVRNEFDDCVDIPARSYHTIEYELSPKQRKLFDSMEQTALSQLDSGVIISAINGAALMTKLLQIASGAAYSEQGSGFSPLQVAANKALGYAYIDNGRNELIADLVAARPHSIVFFNWLHQRDQLIEEFKRRKIRFAVIQSGMRNSVRDELVRDYEQGLYQVLLAHPKSAAHGLTLNTGRAIIWASPTHDLQHFIQGNQRIYRIGQKHKTEVITVIAKDTIESAVHAKLLAKDARQQKTLQLLKEYYESK